MAAPPRRPPARPSSKPPPRAAPARASPPRPPPPPAAGATFPQDDIDNRRLSYEHGTVGQPSDGFTFTLSDGSGGTLALTPVAITIAVTDLTHGLSPSLPL